MTRELGLKNPIFFEAGHRRQYFNYTVFWVYVSKACFHGIFCYYLPTIGYTIASSTGYTYDNWQHSAISFTILLHVVTYKLFIDGRQINLLTFITSTLSIIFYYVTVLIISSSSVAEALDPDLMGTYNILLADSKVWLLIIALPLFCLVPDITIKIYNTYWKRTPIDWQLK